MKRFPFPLLFLLSFTSIALQAADQIQHGEMPESHFAILDKYCLGCHDSDSEKGGINLEDLSFRMDDLETAETWQKVLNATNSGEMPPKDKKQLTAEEKTVFLSDLSIQLATAREALSDSGGVITMRRLNRREYENTIEHLLGVKISAEDLPDDANSGGFDTTGSALFFSSDQFEQYISIARRALDKALAYTEKPEVRKVRTEVEKNANQYIGKIAGNLQKSWDRAEAWKNSGGKPPTEFGFIDSDRVKFETGNYNRFFPTYQAYLDHPDSENGMLLYNFFRGCYGPQITLPSKLPGKYIIRARVAVLHDEVPEHRRYVEFGSLSSGAKGGEINVAGFRKITGTMEDPQIIEFEFTPDGDNTVMIRERHINQAEAAKRFYMKSFSKTKLGPPPALWVDWVEHEGPFIEDNTDPIFFPKPEEMKSWKYHRQVVERFATKAFRGRQPSKSYIDKLMFLYGEQTRAGVKSREAIKEPLSIILASPGFLYFNEPVDGEERRELNPRELAVRLSYFLWSSPPDEELLKLADDDSLKEKSILRKQTMRMLRDPKADEFISGFTHQWLHMERLDFFQFNYEKYPLFDDSIKESARREVYETVKDAILNERPARELLNSDHIVVNNILAEYYGIDGVEGSEFRRVAVPAEMPRGGLLGMTAVMAMGSDGEKPSPVERGAWILRSVLNNPPPPAPANVPQLSRLDGKLLSSREIQKVHQEEPQCAQCHQRIDPLGFGLDNFDAVGLWRDIEVLQLPKAQQKAARKKGQQSMKKVPIDPSGTMPDGTEFADFFELRDRIAEREEAFARGFTENLIEYALGRPFGFTDQGLADRIIARAGQHDYAMNEFILGVVLSKPFKMK